MPSKKPTYDYTSSQRQSAHLERLAAEKGQRTVIDLDALRVERLQALIDAGFGSTKADAIRRAIDAAYDLTIKSKT